VALGRSVRVQTGAAVVAVRAGGLLLWDTVERAGETGSGGHGATGDAGWQAGAWDEQTHEQTQRDEQSQKAKHEQSLGRDKLRGSGRAVEGAVAGRGTPPVGPRPSLMTTVFAGLGGGEGVGASGGRRRGWPEAGRGPGWPPDAGIRDAAAWWPPSSGYISSGALTVGARALSVSARAFSVSAGACWPLPSQSTSGFKQA
jgi:hypothetical protein